MQKGTTFLLMLALSFSATCTINAAELRGKVTKADNSKPLAGAIVFLSSGYQALPTESKAEHSELLIKKKKLVPQVLVVQTNQAFSIRDVDKFGYNFHIDFGNNPKLNLPLGGIHHEHTAMAAKPELFARVWDDFNLLFGYVCVLENQPYAIADQAGNYSFPNLPPGHYTITSAHWNTDRLTYHVDVGDVPQKLDFELLPRAR